MKFNQWVNEQRGRSLAIARAVGVTPPVVSHWTTGKKAIPAEHCQAIFRFTGGEVTIPEMRDDWHKYWPELAEVKAIPSQAATQSIAVGVTV